MENTSLQFFENIILHATINNKLDIIHSCTQITNSIDNYGSGETIWFMDYVKIKGVNGSAYCLEPVKTTISDLYNKALEYERATSLQQLFAEIDSKLDEIKASAANKVKSIEYLLKQYDEKYPEDDYPEIKDALKYVKQQLCSRYDIENTTSKSTSTKKIKWNGQLNVLTTLFYELNDEFLNKGKKYIDIPQTELIDFIVANFCDEKGDDLSRTSIQSYLSNGKPKTRVKGDKRIPLEDILP